MNYSSSKGAHNFFITVRVGIYSRAITLHLYRNSIVKKKLLASRDKKLFAPSGHQPISSLVKYNLTESGLNESIFIRYLPSGEKSKLLDGTDENSTTSIRCKEIHYESFVTSMLLIVLDLIIA